jgi:TPR repeat protein
MATLGTIYHGRKEHVPAVEWFTKSAEAGLPGGMYDLGTGLHTSTFQLNLSRS